MRRIAVLALASLGLGSCADLITPPQDTVYEYRLFVPDGAGGTRPLAFHWPRSSLPVKIWVADNSALRPMVLRAMQQWEDVFLYGEFRAELVADVADADIVVRNETAPVKLQGTIRLPVLAPECRGETTFVADVASGTLQLPFEVYVWSRIGPTGPGLDTCYELTVLHEIGHALGIFDHSAMPGDLMYADPTLNGFSARDRATAEAAYHLPVTVVPVR